MINELIAKIKQDMGNLEKSAESQMIIEQFNRTLEYLKEKSDTFQGVSL